MRNKEVIVRENENYLGKAKIKKPRAVGILSVVVIVSTHEAVGLVSNNAHKCCLLVYMCTAYVFRAKMVMREHQTWSQSYGML